MSNAIQQIADNMLHLWENAVAQPVKMIRIVINPGNETMLKAFYDYMLAIDSEEEDMVFFFALPFTSAMEFSKDVLQYIGKQIEYWNNAKKPEDIIFEKVEWQADDSSINSGNTAQTVVENLNRLTRELVSGTDMKCSFIFNLEGTMDYEGCRQWFNQALSQPFDKQMVWGTGDITGQEQFGKLMATYPKETASIYPPIDMDGATEKLAEQAANEDRSDPAASEFRLALTRLMSSVKKGDAAQTDLYARKCLDMALANVKKDLNWLSQFVTVYTILYTDHINHKDLDMALYFANKAVEAAQLGEGKLAPSLSGRLLGSSLVGKASIQVRKSDWNDAAETYRMGADAYANCKDYLMQAETLRMCGWCWEKAYDTERATECYIEGFRLANKLSSDLIRHSSYPLLLLKLLESRKRQSAVSNEEINSVLSRAIGKDWEDFLYEYKRNLGKYHGMDQQNMDNPPTNVQ
ncbi:hypothetical protein [Phocaeicola vulgatus]|uniref:hypothetical protein n=1 Tax=Phocaeicola vulgatus TaxID=821 RepID=UPI001F16E332|nr:hypothetical protein [Phocaeicola vulgatus]MCE8725427.1 hypothetical protein [Phocaeicola vulgatus]